MEWTLVDNKELPYSESIDLSGLALTSLYYPERLCCYKTINCSKNQLKNSASFAAFTSCDTLNISNNLIPVDISLIKFLEQRLPNLKKLKMFGNPGFDLSRDFETSVTIF
jgi:Leucine-rich repeat (LRR) protein